MPYNPIPSSFWFNTHDCGSTILRGQTMTNVWMITDPPGSLSPILASSNLYVLADGIPIMWEATDKAVLDWWAAASPAQVTTALSTSTSPSLFRTLPGGSTPNTTTAITTSSAPPPQFQTLPSSSTPTTTAAAAAITTSSAPPPSSQDAQPSSDGGLSTGAKAGIGISVGIAVIVIIVAMYFVRGLRRRRMRRG
jgi:hypothetical protein